MTTLRSRRAPARPAKRRDLAGPSHRADRGTISPDLGTGRGDGRRRGRPVFADDAVLKMSCADCVCKRVEILDWKEHATPDKVTGVTDPKGAGVTDAALKQQLIDAVFAQTGPKAETPETRWPTKAVFQNCPQGCTCPSTGIAWDKPEETDQEVQVPVEVMEAGTPKIYTVAVKLKVKRRLGSAKCT
jgi:hypothetical protein